MTKASYPKSTLSLLLAFFLMSCSSSSDQDLEEIAKRDRTPKTKLERLKDKTDGYIFGEPLFSIGTKKAEDSNIGVNSYLWRASLSVAALLPKVKADPFGGVIITDWHEDPHASNERLKLEIIIIGRQLRSDALRVSVFRQKKTKGAWHDAPVSQETIDTIEETILKRARDIRVQEER